MCLKIIFTLLCLCCSVVFQILLIIIKPWFQSFNISSSPTSIPSLSLPHLPQFFFYFQNRTCTKTPLQVEFHELCFQRAIMHMKRVPNKRLVPILLRRCNLSKVDFRLRNAQCFCHISLYGLQNWWFLMHWKEGLKEVLNINFSSIVHLWTFAQILMEIATSFPSLVDD
jgi:hypothetical protein